ncbi:MAG TPA: tetratricopeptide repeat protein [Desulfobacterales bacterium]|nr:tetratricopeptide repeat protein [Desulfobacterales bacterium]
MGDEMLHYLRKTGFILMGMSLLVALPLFAASVETLLKEAREKAYSKDYTAAIIIYDAILKKYPSNLEAKNGKARVLSWAGKYDEAEKIYQEVLSGYPKNIEAQTGLADIYAWQKQYAKATEFLEDILSRDRKNRDVLVRLARFHMWAGEKKQSIFYSNLILKIYPGDRDAKLIKRQAQEIYTFEFYTGYNYLRISDNPSGYNLYAGIRYLPKTQITMYGQIDYLDKYNEIDGRGLLGGSYQISNKYILSSEMGISPDAEIYPRVFGWIELSSPVFPSAAISARVFGSQYKVVDSYGISFAGEYYTFGYVSISPRVTFSQTEFHSGGKASDTAYMIKITKFFTDKDKIFAYYAYGSESYKAETIDLIGDIDARTYGLGGTFFLNPQFGISPFVEYQDRSKNSEFVQFGIELKWRS